MEPPESRPTNQQAESATDRNYPRRQFLALGTGIGVSVIAGCSTQTNSTPAGTAAAATNEETSIDDGIKSTDGTGTFRLLVSDQPTAIGDFDRLDVSLDRARVFPADANGDGEEEQTETATETGSRTATGTDTEAEPESETDTEIEEEDEKEEEEDEDAEEEREEDEKEEEEDEDAEEEQEEEGQADSGDGEQRGFFEISLEGVTVDLTEVVGDRALGVFNGDLPAGRYTKVELHVANVEGIVNGEQVTVKVPSEKLQITKPFEVVAGETLTFVFDINVVKKGQTGEYNLLPVISESGVADQDVEVEEVESSETEEQDADQPESEGNGNESDGGPPDETGEDV